MVKVPKLRDWRTKRALTMRDLSEKANVATTTILRLEQGQDANLTTVRKLAEALQVDPALLYESI